MADYQPTSGKAITLPCVVCSTEFTFTTKRRGRYPRFCSPQCKVQRTSRALRAETCRTCGSGFHPKHLSQTQREAGHGLYCSMACRPQSQALPVDELAAHERMYRQMSYARGKGADVVDQVDWRDVFDRDGWVCGICGEAVDPTLEAPDHEAACINHVQPLSKGGGHSAENLRCAHWICSSLLADRAEAA